MLRVHVPPGRDLAPIVALAVESAEAGVRVEIRVCSMEELNDAAGLVEATLHDDRARLITIVAVDP